LEAYILINSESGKLWNIAEEALKIEGVKMANAVTGQFDIVAYVEFTRMDMLGEIINKFQSIEGVLKTQTAVGIPKRLDSEK
jgi:hypothetical protein